MATVPAEPRTTAPVAASTPDVVDELIETKRRERLAAIEKWGREQVTAATLDEADRLLPFDLKRSDSRLVGKLVGIYFTDRKRPELREVTIIYERRPAEFLSISAKSRAKPFDYRRWVDRSNALRANDPSGSTAPLRLVRVRGRKGSGMEPGLNVGKLIGTDRLRPGVVDWWEKGVNYTLVGEPGTDGTPLSDLLVIARLME